MNRHLILPLLSSLLLFSCISTKEMRYFADEELDQKIPAYFPQELPDYKLAPNDIVAIRIKTDEPILNTAYNIMDDGGFTLGNPGANYLSGYTIDIEGNVDLPVIGELGIAGLSISQARDSIQSRIDTLVYDASVFVHLLNFKVSILGEVNRPGYYYMYNPQVNILEALAMAGDLTEVADRQEVFLVRQQDGGSIATPLDLTSVDILNSEAYFLQPNDVLYVAPLEQKTKRSNLVVTNTVISALSLAASFTTIIVSVVLNSIN